MRPDRALRVAPLTDTDWERGFTRALDMGDILGASSILRETGGTGVISRAHLERARALIAEIGPAPLVRREWTLRLLAHQRLVDQQLAAMIVAPLAATHRGDAERALLRLEQDQRPEVTAAAAEVRAALDKAAH